jgi:hypothetical protein
MTVGKEELQQSKRKMRSAGQNFVLNLQKEFIIGNTSAKCEEKYDKLPLILE